MTDVFSKEKRSQIMSKIRGRDTLPEKKVRSIIHRMGFRFSLHKKDLPGKPDIVLTRHKKIVLVHGCFWHGHNKCKFAYTPKTNTEFWVEKIKKNITRDKKVKQELQKRGWKVLEIWECEISYPKKLLQKISEFLEENRL